MTDPTITSGRILFVLGNIITTAGSFAADYSETHIFNKNWPPHAKFHNGQTMSLSVCLATASLYFAFRPSLPNNTISSKESAFVAAALGSFYCFAGITAILYPGTHWCDPEFPNDEAQKYVFAGVVVAMWVGYVLEAMRISGSSAKGKLA